MATRAAATLESDYRTLEQAVGVFERSERGKLDVAGPDALEFLNGQVTNDISSLEAGHGCYAALLNPKGRILADMRVLARGAEELWLDTEAVALETALANLRMYKIGRRVEIADRTSERAIVSLIGPEAAGPALAALELADGRRLPETEHHFAEASLGGETVVLARTELGFDLLLEAGQARRAIEVLVESGAVSVGGETVEVVRIESGRPRYGVDMTDENLPAEAGIVEQAVSFTKGCYVGQEPVARMHYKGHPNRHLRGLSLSEPAAPGQALIVSGKEIGRVSSACVSPALGPIALALVRREVVPGDELTLGQNGPPARVLELPFERP